MREVEAAGAAVLLYDLDGVLHATAAICPHHAAWLSEGGVDGGYVNCPRHQGRFEIATGRQVRGPACGALRVYPVRVEAGQVMVGV
jgi:nitrite reductase/ring-hydroxylating ferredoxin subunit